jgi:putative hydrolase of the HAD superfamily
MNRFFLFDLDDTICDYTASIENARKRIGVILREAWMPEVEFWSRFDDFEPRLHAMLVTGFLSSAEYRWRKFADVCASFSDCVGVLPEIMDRIFYDETVNRCKLFDDVVGAFETALAQGIVLGVLAEGDSIAQREKFRKLGLGAYVDAHRFYVTEELGSSKPEPALFRRVLSQSGFSPENSVMVGDSLELDIWGAESLGMRGILLDRKGVFDSILDVERVRTLEGLCEYLSESNSLLALSRQKIMLDPYMAAHKKGVDNNSF